MKKTDLFLRLLRAAYLLNPAVQISRPHLVMRTNKIFALLALVLALPLAQVEATYAAVIYDNGAAPINWAVESDHEYLAYIADDFSLAPGANVITDIHWTGAYGSSIPPHVPTEPDDFTINIYADAGGVPADNPLHSVAVGDPGRVDTGDDIGNGPFPLDVFAYSADIAAIALPANTTFWLSIFNDTTADGSDYWLWSGQEGAGNGNAVFLVQGQPWLPLDDQFRTDFQLTNDNLSTVPEPATMLLLGTGSVGLAAFSRRRFRK